MAFLFNKVGLVGCDIGVCAVLLRIIGQGRASELLYTGRFMGAEEGERWGFFSRLVEASALLEEAQALASMIGRGPTFANTTTKCMQAMERGPCRSRRQSRLRPSRRAFAAKENPVIQGN